MKKHGNILNSQLNSVIAHMGHTDTIVIGDAVFSRNQLICE